MMVLTRRPKHVRKNDRIDAVAANPQSIQDNLKTVAIGLGTVELLLDVGQTDAARQTLRKIRDELQVLRRSLPG